MRKLLQTIIAAVFVALGFFGAHAQSDRSENGSYAAPVIWTSYKIPSQNLMISLPKLPIVRERNDPCSQTQGARYYAYAREAVYEFEWQAKSGLPFPTLCQEKTSFSQKAYFDRLHSLRQNTGYTESEEMVFGTKAKVFRLETPYGITTRRLIWDIDRWFELVVSRRSDAGDESRFVRGLTLSNAQAMDINDGSSQILGDDDVEEGKLVKGEKISTNLAILTKPPPRYTEEARTASVHGSVTLRATFLHNGGIGDISVVKGLSHGLTEQAIAAARAVSFLPAKVDGKPVTVVKQIEYHFSIY